MGSVPPNRNSKSFSNASANGNRQSASSASLSSSTARSAASLLHRAMLLVALTSSTVAGAAAASNNNRNTNVIDASSMHPQQPPAIPFCNERQNERTVGRRLLYVTTLDGQLSALDITKGGKLHWSIPTGPGPLLSSSIHRLELTNNGQFVRMIPSLSGGIYKFDGEYIDPIPITTDDLLSSSAKFSDDLVISGGKEMRTYGVSARTGQLLYESSMHGRGDMSNTTADNGNSTGAVTTDFKMRERDDDDDDVSDNADNDGNDNVDETADRLVEHNPHLDDVIVVRRQTQTVRAVETRTGLERWNFSVGQHELNLVKAIECHKPEFSDLEMAIVDLEVRVIVPEGLICAFSKSDPAILLWKYQFAHPIVSAWKIGLTDELEPINLFSSAQWLWDHEDNLFEAPTPVSSPAIYLGMYERQLYIQESVALRKEIVDQSNLYSHLTSDSKMPKIPWRPILASSNYLSFVQQDDHIIGQDGRLAIESGETLEGIQGHELMPYNEGDFAVSAQSVLNGSEYVNGNGFYLYAQDDDDDDDEYEQSCKQEHPAIEGERSDNETNEPNSNNDGEFGYNMDDMDVPVRVVVLSLWFWWKEIVLIAFTSALLFNLFMGQRTRPEREIVVIERHIPVPTAMEATESSTIALLGPTTNSSKSVGNGHVSRAHRSLSESTTHSGDHFSSRFLDDFDLLRCLGRGGFGVVFEAKNKLDDCKYAVKRITLPNKKESRERVMREVKTLANCEHHNIVRYFQAWVETPPPGWQEEEDRKLLAHEMSTSIQIETLDGSMLPSYYHRTEHSHMEGGKLQMEKKKQLLSWMSSMADTACSADFEGGHDLADVEEEEQREDAEDEEDSCVVFRSESKSMALRSDNSDRNRPIGDAVAIDIFSNSFDLSRYQNGGSKLDYAQLSDSFQIEFVRSTNADESGSEDDVNGNAVDEQSLAKCKSAKANGNHHGNFAANIRHEFNNNHKDLLPALPNATTALSVTPPKPLQNKVYLYIQMQLCRKESLRDWLRDNRHETRENHIGSIFYQIVDAVDYVHLKGLIHRDLKPSNIFFSQDGQIKIGDFGLVTDMSDIPNLITKCSDKTGLPSCARHTQQVGTHLYMSPEQLHGKHYDFKVDIYSLGLIFFELLVYFTTEMERIVTLRNLRDGRYPLEFPSNYPAEFELLQLMLSEQPVVRPPTTDLKAQLNSILKLTDVVGDSEAATLAAAARRLSRSRTFSTSE